MTIENLKKKSQERVESSERFGGLYKILAEREVREERGEVQIVRLGDLLDKPEEELPQPEEQRRRELSSEEKRDRYLQRVDIQEATHIMVDYLEELGRM